MKTLKERFGEELGSDTKEDIDAQIQASISAIDIIRLWLKDNNGETMTIQAYDKVYGHLSSLEIEADKTDGEEDEDEEEEEEEEEQEEEETKS